MSRRNTRGGRKGHIGMNPPVDCYVIKTARSQDDDLFFLLFHINLFYIITDGKELIVLLTTLSHFSPSSFFFIT